MYELIHSNSFDSTSNVIIESMSKMNYWMQNSFWSLILSYIRSLTRNDELFVNLLKKIKNNKQKWFKELQSHRSRGNHTNIWMTSEALDGLIYWIHCVYRSKNVIYQIYDTLLSFPTNKRKNLINNKNTKDESPTLATTLFSDSMDQFDEMHIQLLVELLTLNSSKWRNYVINKLNNLTNQYCANDNDIDMQHSKNKSNKNNKSDDKKNGMLSNRDETFLCNLLNFYEYLVFVTANKDSKFYKKSKKILDDKDQRQLIAKFLNKLVAMNSNKSMHNNNDLLEYLRDFNDFWPQLSANCLDPKLLAGSSDDDSDSSSSEDEPNTIIVTQKKLGRVQQSHQKQQQQQQSQQSQQMQHTYTQQQQQQQAAPLQSIRRKQLPLANDDTSDSSEDEMNNSIKISKSKSNKKVSMVARKYRKSKTKHKYEASGSEDSDISTNLNKSNSKNNFKKRSGRSGRSGSSGSSESSSNVSNRKEKKKKDKRKDKKKEKKESGSSSKSKVHSSKEREKKETKKEKVGNKKVKSKHKKEHTKHKHKKNTKEKDTDTDTEILMNKNIQQQQQKAVSTQKVLKTNDSISGLYQANIDTPIQITQTKQNTNDNSNKSAIQANVSSLVPLTRGISDNALKIPKKSDLFRNRNISSSNSSNSSASSNSRSVSNSSGNATNRVRIGSNTSNSGSNKTVKITAAKRKYKAANISTNVSNAASNINTSNNNNNNNNGMDANENDKDAAPPPLKKRRIMDSRKGKNGSDLEVSDGNNMNILDRSMSSEIGDTIHLDEVGNERNFVSMADKYSNENASSSNSLEGSKSPSSSDAPGTYDGWLK